MTGMASLWSNLLVGLPAGLSCRGKETATALLTTAVSAFPSSSLNRATKTVSEASEEPEGNRGPHESESLDTKACVLAVGVELVAALDIDGSNETGGYHLEDESDPSHDGRNIASDACAHSS